MSAKKNIFSKINSDKQNLRDVDEPDSASVKVKKIAVGIKKRWEAGKKARATWHFNPKYLLAALSAICIAFIILSVSVEDFRAPFKAAASIVIEPAQNGVNKLGLWISDKLSMFKSVAELQEENESLRDEVDRLTSVNESLRQNENELSRLRELLSLKELYSEYDMIAAQVVAKDSAGWFSTFTINRGSLDGIEPDMNIIADGALVGIVTDVGLNYSVVRAIIDDDSNVSAEFQNTGGLCTVSGNIKLLENNLIEFSQVDILIDLEINDTVVTSHISSKYLPGLIIGYVASYETDANELTQSGYITPAADFTNLKEVLVITTLKETWDADNESETN